MGRLVFYRPSLLLFRAFIKIGFGVVGGVANRGDLYVAFRNTGGLGQGFYQTVAQPEGQWQLIAARSGKCHDSRARALFSRAVLLASETVIVSSM